MNVEAPDIAGPLDETQQSFAGGMRDRDHASTLLPNEAAKLTNAEIRDAGLAKTRRGSTTKTTSGPGANPQDVIYFDPPGTVAPILVQVNDGKFWTWDGTSSGWTRIGTTQLTNTSSQVSMVVLNGKLFVFSGQNDNVWSWDGSAGSFTDEGNTNTDPPRGDIAIVQAGRICVGGVISTPAITDATNYIFFSDIFDGTTWDRAANNKRVPTSYGEAVTALACYRKEEILAFTRNSSHIYNITGSTVSNFSLLTIDPRVGCIAPKSVVVVGEDAFFLSPDKHVRTIKRTVQDISLGVSVPITYENPTLMDRINTANANKCAAILFDNYYLLSCPMDTFTYNNTIVAFDLLQQKQGVSGIIPSCAGEWTGLNPQTWSIGFFSSKNALFYIDSIDGKAHQLFTTESDDGAYPTLGVDYRGASHGSSQHDKTLHSGELQLLNTFGTMVVSYAKDDGSFTTLITKTISDTGSRLPINLPFTLSAAGVLAFLPLTFYRRGRSRYWQLRISHSGGVAQIKQTTLRAFVESVSTRGY